MKTSITYMLIFTLLTGVGFAFVCNKVNSIEVSPIQLSIALLVEEEDFLVLYHRSKNEHFTKEKRIKQRITGDSILHTFNYQLPAGTTNVRIDLSQNKNQEYITINNITLDDAKGNSKILKDEQLRALRFNRYCHNFETSEKGLRFNTQTRGARYSPQIEDLNLPYLLYYAR